MRELSAFGILPCRSAEFNYVSAPGYQVFMQIRQSQKGYEEAATIFDLTICLQNSASEQLEEVLRQRCGESLTVTIFR